MIYAFDLHLMSYTTNMTRPIGYDFLKFDSFPTDNEIYNVIMEKYNFLHGASAKKTYLFNVSKICIGITFKFEGMDYRLIVNNVRSIGKNKNIEKYISKIEI